jgi:hypothetical protein
MQELKLLISKIKLNRKATNFFKRKSDLSNMRFFLFLFWKIKYSRKIKTIFSLNNPKTSNWVIEIKIQTERHSKTKLRDYTPFRNKQTFPKTNSRNHEENRF